MIIDTNNIVSITEANQNFSQITKKVEKNGPVVILKNNKPRYIVMEYKPEISQKEKNETVMKVAEQLMEEYSVALRELAK